jgi:Na+/melibiose symporter-like transporter
MAITKILRSKGLWIGVASTIALFVVSLAAMSWGVSMLGSVDAWERMLDQAAPLLFVWRCLVYAAMVWCWLWLKRRVLERDPSADARKRLLRVEIAVGLTVVVFELVNAGVI